MHAPISTGAWYVNMSIWMNGKFPCHDAASAAALTKVSNVKNENVSKNSVTLNHLFFGIYAGQHLP